MHNGEKWTWNCERCVDQCVKYHVILGNVMEYGNQGLSSIRCDKLFTAVITVKVDPVKYEKDFNAVAPSLTLYIDKRAQTISVNVASVVQPDMLRGRRPALHMAPSKMIELKKYSQEEYDSMSTAQHQQCYELQKNAGLTEGRTTPESRRVLQARAAMCKAKMDNSSNESLFADEKLKANIRNDPALDRKGSRTRQSHADT